MSISEQSGGRTFDIDIVVVNWNSGSLLKECLTAIDLANNAESARVVVIDNASTDGSADRLKGRRFHLDLIKNASNRGFAAACNQGARTGSAPAVLFLNPDVRVFPDTIERALVHLQATESLAVGIVGVQLLESDGKISYSCARRPTTFNLLLQGLLLDRLIGAPVSHFMTDFDHRSTCDVDQVSGAFLLIKRPLYERLGGFDERFFVYYEDLDLCVSAADHGAQVRYYAGARAIHRGGGTTNAIIGRRLYYVFRSRIEYAIKRHGRSVAMLVLVLIALVEIPARLIQALLGAGLSRGKDIGEATTLLLRDMPGILCKIFTVGRRFPS